MSFFSQKQDVIDIEITETGVIKSTTPKISAANHSTANAFFRILSRLTGGSVDIKRRDKTADTHTHDHIQGAN